MRRLVGAITCGLLVSCTQTPPEPPPGVIASAPPSTAVPSVTPSPELTLEPTQTCDGFGRASFAGQITFVREGRLIAVSPDGTEERCLADLEGLDIGGPTALAWNAPGDRVLVGGRALARDLKATRKLASGGTPSWSRPTGTSVVWIDGDGRLMKRSSLGGKAIDITFLTRHDDVTYHPAGTHIATSGLADDGSYGLYLATNVGTEQKLIARGERARFITNLTFTEDGGLLYYTARHGPENWHLHRMRIGAEASLETLAKQASDFQYAVSPTDPFQLAWFVPGDCAAGEHGTFRISYPPNMEIPDELRASDLRPIGWLGPKRLLVTSSPISCGTAAPHDLYVLRRKAPPVLIAEEIGATATIRRVAPPPPPPPGEEQEVVA